MEAAEQSRPFLVDALHLGEILRRLGLAGEHHFNELVLGGGAEAPVGDFFVAKCREGNCAERFTARRACAVPGPDLEVVGKLFEAVETSIESASTGFHGSDYLRRFLEKVGPSDIADENEVASHCSHRLVRCGCIRD